MRVVILGPMPPPYGGVSTHVRRLRERIRVHSPCEVWSRAHEAGPADHCFGNFEEGLRALLELPEETIYHAHAYHLLAGRLAKEGRRVVVTIHNPRLHRVLAGTGSLRSWFGMWPTRRAFRAVRHFIAVSDGARDSIVTAGLRGRSIRVINAFLPPGPDETADPENLRQLADFRRRHRQVVTANAWRLDFFAGEDLYGVDLCLALIERFAREGRSVGLVLALPLAEGSDYLRQLQEQADALQVSDRVLWLTRPGAYHPIIRECDLFLRPTNTDGFSISIAEAFEVGVPVVASDAVPRPRGCVLFRSRDQDEFYGAVRRSLDDLPALRSAVPGWREPDHFDEIHAVYREIAAGQSR